LIDPKLTAVLGFDYDYKAVRGQTKHFFPHPCRNFNGGIAGAKWKPFPMT